MNDSDQPGPALTDIQAARMLLEKMGISPADLLLAPAAQREAPTFAHYIPRVSGAVSVGTRRVYNTYWNRVIEAWGPRQITNVTALEIGQLAEHVKATVVKRRNARGGRGAAEHLIAALRCMYRYAVADGILDEQENPAARVPKPRRLQSARTALPDQRLAELSRVAASTGNDPALDALLLRLHAETACRRGGALALLPEGLDHEHCLIQLHEKGGTMRWQPVSPTLMSHLVAHGKTRGGLDSGQRLLRYPNGQPITYRRYDYLWQRLGQHLPWVATQQVSMHWVRHTVLTWVERNFGFAVAQAYAGHEEYGQGGRAMATYVRAGSPEVATALAALTGEPHPLALSATPPTNSRQTGPPAPLRPARAAACRAETVKAWDGSIVEPGFYYQSRFQRFPGEGRGPAPNSGPGPSVNLTISISEVRFGCAAVGAFVPAARSSRHELPDSGENAAFAWSFGAEMHRLDLAHDAGEHLAR